MGRALWVVAIAWLLAFPLLHSLLTRVDIVSFEFAGSATRARELLRGVPASEVDGLRWGIRLDFVYLAVYGAAGSVLCRSWAPRQAQAAWWRKLCQVGVWAWLGAAACDAVENVAMLAFLRDTSAAGSSMAIARAAAAVKFALVLLGAGVLLRAWLYRRAAARRPVTVSAASVAAGHSNGQG